MSNEDAHHIAQLAIAAHIAEAALNATGLLRTKELFEARRAQHALRDAIQALPSSAFKRID